MYVDGCMSVSGFMHSVLHVVCYCASSILFIGVGGDGEFFVTLLQNIIYYWLLRVGRIENYTSEKLQLAIFDNQLSIGVYIHRLHYIITLNKENLTIIIISFEENAGEQGPSLVSLSVSQDLVKSLVE